MMNAPRCFAAGVGAIAIAACASRAAAQQRRLDVLSDSVPRALAEALIAPQFEVLGLMGIDVHRRPSLIVGRLPNALAGRLWLPPGARVLGGVEVDNFATAIIESRLPPESLSVGYRRAELGLGWTLPPSPEAQIAVSGFVPADVAANSNPTTAMSFCATSSMLGISIDTAGGIPLVRAVTLPIRPEICLPRANRASGGFGFREYPTLRNPPGSGDGNGRGCASFNSSGTGGSTTLVAASSIDDVLAAYGRQLTTAGWSLTSGETRGETWSRTDSAGTYVELTLTAQRRAQAPQCVHVRMEASSRHP